LRLNMRFLKWSIKARKKWGEYMLLVTKSLAA
jgi:hypothetical protein